MGVARRFQPGETRSVRFKVPLAQETPMSHALPKLALASAALAVALAPTAASAGSSATAAKSCTVKKNGASYSITGRKHLSCKAAKAAFKAYSPSHTHGYTCSPKQITFSGSCHKGTKKFTYTAQQGQQQGKRS
jgi:hypothetical protein